MNLRGVAFGIVSVMGHVELTEDEINDLLSGARPSSPLAARSAAGDGSVTDLCQELFAALAR